MPTTSGCKKKSVYMIEVGGRDQDGLKKSHPNGESGRG